MNPKLCDTHEVFDPIINSKISAYKYLSIGKFLKTPKGMKDIGLPFKYLYCTKSKYLLVYA